MFRNSRSVLLGLAGLALAASPAAAQTKWNLPSAYPATNFHTENLAQFAKDVEANSGGKLTLTLHPGASLFKAPEIKRAVQTGQAEIGEVLVSLLENEDPVFGADVVPFLATSYAEAKKLYAATKPAMQKKFESQGIILLYAVPWPPQGIYAKKDINTVNDLKGLKWRAYNAGTTRIAELAGAQAVTVQQAELAQALATGVVESFMTSGATGVDTKAWETMSHFYDVQAWIPKNVVIVSKAAFDKLDKATQDAVLKAAKAAEDRGWKVSEEKTSGFLATLKANKMKVLPPSPELKAGLAKIGDTLAAEWSKRAGADGEAVLKAFKK
ncbi:MAG: TRAP transporter substrate-binding protein [Xanthobacteraceae bacterium]|nr:TRAP transporter substrate-binding protein [Xanthobacteraceae bacterium]